MSHDMSLKMDCNAVCQTGCLQQHSDHCELPHYGSDKARVLHSSPTSLVSAVFHSWVYKQITGCLVVITKYEKENRVIHLVLNLYVYSGGCFTLVTVKHQRTH